MRTDFNFAFSNLITASQTVVELMVVQVQVIAAVGMRTSCGNSAQNKTQYRESDVNRKCFRHADEDDVVFALPLSNCHRLFVVLGV